MIKQLQSKPSKSSRILMAAIRTREILEHLFPHMKTWFATQRFDDDEEFHSGVRAWLKSQASKFYDDGVNKLVYRCDKCLNLYGDYIEKLLNNLPFKCN
ncbi:hypothetical protein AVEN_220709-1 [Araneus ventricosus]|uniref:Uncharacterized protein n=1 Tax=Araneus ventricosus TaxID=182803 RepID=A0A4Y2TXR6_ARAVE|nr:hypothetical protein AVEN_220709-1 [Araneus ventricosus]